VRRSPTIGARGSCALLDKVKKWFTVFSGVRQMFGNLSVDDGEKLITLLKRLSQKMDQAI
jgi:hypothetical protein